MKYYIKVFDQYSGYVLMFPYSLHIFRTYLKIPLDNGESVMK